MWIAGPLTGGRTEHHTIHTDCGLGPLENVLVLNAVYIPDG
ncbi:hypothetical protein PO124_20160 [Bacillus licheniformis]|nr:hypothetical protein [Bacillus licheniformis]